MKMFQLSHYYAVACAVAAAFLLWALFRAVRDYRLLRKRNVHSKRFFTPGRILFAGVLVGSAVIFLPLYMADMCAVTENGTVVEADMSVSNCLKALCLAIHQAIRLFAVDGEYYAAAEMIESPLLTAGTLTWVADAYLPTIAVLCVAAPILTFTFVLSFFRNMWSMALYRFCAWRPVHIFSELNEHTIALAASIVSKKKGKIFCIRPIIIFTDVLKKQEEESFDLIQSAKQIHALCFDKDLASVRFRRLFNPYLRFYILSENEDENMRHLADIRRNYDSPWTEVYIFSDKIQSTLILGVKQEMKMKIYRVFDKQSLIYQNLDRFGMRLFERSYREVEVDENGVFSSKETGRIKVILVGFGQYGVEMCKGLSWFCQLAGYCLDLEIFDREENIEDKARLLMPDFVPPAVKEGEPAPPAREDDDVRLQMHFHGGTDVFGAKFESDLRAISDATYIFVGLGTDEINIRVAVQIRRIFESMRVAHLQSLTAQLPKVKPAELEKRLPAACLRPDIETVVYDSNISRSLGVTWPVPGALETAKNALERGGELLLKRSRIHKKMEKHPEKRYRLTFTVDVQSFWSVLVAKETDPAMLGIRGRSYEEDLDSCLSLFCKTLKKDEGAPVTLCAEEEGTTIRFVVEVTPAKLEEEDLWSRMSALLPDALSAAKERYWNDKTCDGVKNHKDQPYRIHMTGDLEDYYSCDTVINSTLISAGMTIHRRYDAVAYAFHKSIERVFDLVNADRKGRPAPEEHWVYLAECGSREVSVTGYAYSEWTTRFGIDTPEGSAVAALLKKRGITAEQPEKKTLLAIRYVDLLNKNHELEVMLHSEAAYRDLKRSMIEYEEQTGIRPVPFIRRRKKISLRLDFEKNEYSYFSSIAKALHERLRLKMLYSGFFCENRELREALRNDDRWTEDRLRLLISALATKWSERDMDQVLQIGRLEHIRWNAYMRSEGYTYGAVRNDLAKTHHNIVPLSKLTESDIRKDA